MKKPAENEAAARSGQGTLGTFGGVFTPSVLTILGIILFMRLGYVVGDAGLKRALVIIGMANLISIMTTFSLSAIATNLKVKGGGDYYLISRTLGVQFGGAIGIVLYLAQSVSIGFYCIGFGEALARMLPWSEPWLPQAIAAAAGMFLFFFAWLGADWATRFQYLVMAALVASLASFFIGGIGRFDPALVVENWEKRPGTEEIWILFAIFFPAVTGFTQGVSMSGDLKNPGKSLPLGTFLAVGVSVAVYFAAALLFAGTMPAETLSHDFSAMKRIAAIDWLISAGVIAATLSSAMASFLGAPRILQSMAQDRIFAFLTPFARGSGPSANPRRGVLLSALVAGVTIAAGRLNLIAPVVSMFFLISYGLLNYATWFEARTESPSFRPRFRWFDRRVSLLGALACLAAMMAINFAAGLVAVSILAAVYQYLKRTAGPARWADSRRAYHFQRLREHLFAIGEEPEHPRNWRPRLLVFSNDANRREQLLRFSSWIEGGAGLATAVKILVGQGIRARMRRDEEEEKLLAEIAEIDVEAFGRVILAPTVLEGARALIQSWGIGSVRANTVILNWPEQVLAEPDNAGQERYGRYLRAALRLGCNVIAVDAKMTEWDALGEQPAGDRRIDIWWSNDATSRLTLLLAYLMTRSGAWDGAAIRVLTLTARDGEENGCREELGRILDEARIEAECKAIDARNADSIVAESADASLVFLPLRLHNYLPADPFGNPLDDLFERLPVVAVVLAAEDIPLDADPEEGGAAETALVRDAATDTEKRALEAETEVQKAEARIAALEKELAKLVEEGRNGDKISALEKALREAGEDAHKAVRRAAKARAKAIDAASAAEALEKKTKPADDPNGSGNQ